ncbi:hypothetical protein ASG63_16615 [Methylobacterium sp. Leaf94]|nr:hypothetical protein ASG63_16615 [Methylobacterium sp. Leaf94]
MAHGFVQQSGGRLEIESAVGRGTTVSMILPRDLQRDERGDRPPDAPRYRVKTFDASTATSLILVVDDSREAAAMADEALQGIGYRVVVAYSAEEVLPYRREQLSQLSGN